MEPRDDLGKFAPKSDAERKVRSIRATDWVWDEFGFFAGSRGITRADLLEQWVKSGGMRPAPRTEEIPFDLGPVQVAIAVEELRQALTLKANAGGAIKEKIRAALATLNR